MVTADDLERIERLAEEATPGPWEWTEDEVNPRYKKARERYIYLLQGRSQYQLDGPIPEWFVTQRTGPRRDPFDHRVLALNWAYIRGSTFCGSPKPADAAFIAASRTAVPCLIQEVRSCWDRIATLEGRHQEAGMDTGRLEDIEAELRAEGLPGVSKLVRELVREIRRCWQIMAALCAVAPDEKVPVPPRPGGLRITLLVQHHLGKPDLFCPMVYCDGCGALIEGTGNYLYEVVEPGGPATGEVFFFHKGCDRMFEAIRGGRWYWGELQDFPFQLAANLSMIPEKHGISNWTFRKLPDGVNPSQAAAAPTILRTVKLESRRDPQRTFSSMQKKEIYLRCNGHCVSCGQPLDSNWHADHILPHSRGGRTEIINGQALCQPCNSRKRAKILTVDEE